MTWMPSGGCPSSYVTTRTAWRCCCKRSSSGCDQGYRRVDYVSCSFSYGKGVHMLGKQSDLRDQHTSDQHCQRIQIENCVDWVWMQVELGKETQRQMLQIREQTLHNRWRQDIVQPLHHLCAIIFLVLARREHHMSFTCSNRVLGLVRGF